MTMLADSLTLPVEIDWNDPVGVDWDFAQEIGAVAWYPGWPIGGTTLFDLVGNKHASNVGSPIWTFGVDVRGPALSYNGSNQYSVADGSSIDETAAIAISLFAFPTGTTTARIFQFRDANRGLKIGFNGDSGNYFHLLTGDNGSLWGNDTSERLRGASTTNAWYHISGSCDSTPDIVNGYINGIPITDTGGGQWSIGSDTDEVCIGCRTDKSSVFNGRISDVVVMQKVLAASHALELTKPYRLAWQPSRVSIFDFAPASGGGGGQTVDIESALIQVTGIVPATSKATTAPIALAELLGIAPATSKSTTAPIALADLLAPAPTTRFTAAVPTGLTELTSLAPTTAKQSPVLAALVEVTAPTTTTIIAVAITPGTVEVTAIAPSTSKAATVPAGLIEVTTTTPTTAMLASVNAGLIEVVSITPTTSKAASVGTGLIIVTAGSLDGSQTVSVPVAAIDVAAFSSTTSKVASVPVGAVEVSSAAPTTSKVAAVDTGLIATSSVAISTLMLASVGFGQVDVIGMAIESRKSEAVDVGLVVVTVSGVLGTEEPVIVPDLHYYRSIAKPHYTRIDTKTHYYRTAAKLHYAPKDANQ